MDTFAWILLFLPYGSAGSHMIFQDCTCRISTVSSEFTILGLGPTFVQHSVGVFASVTSPRYHGMCLITYFISISIAKDISGILKVF